MADVDDDFTAALERAGVRGLSAADLLHLREAWTRLQRPLSLPAGFDRTTVPACVACCPLVHGIDD